MQKFLLSAVLYFLMQLGLSTPGSAQSPFNFCAAYHCNDVALSGVHFDLTLTGIPAIPPLTLSAVSDTTGCVSFVDGIPVSSNLMPALHIYKDGDPLEGVNTLDLVLISQHILGLEPLNSPFKMIAADANKSGSITTSDIVELRNLILGVYTEFPNNTSWRFLDTNFTFPDPANPFQGGYDGTDGPPRKLLRDQNRGRELHGRGTFHRLRGRIAHHAQFIRTGQ